MSNESMLPSKLGKHFVNKHSQFISLMTISDKAQIASYQVSELIAQNMKAHTMG